MGAPVAQVRNGTFQPLAAPSNATDADDDRCTGNLERLEGLVSRGKAMTNLAKEELESTSAILLDFKCYMGAGDAEAPSSSSKKSSDSDFFTTIVKFLGTFRSVW